MLSYKITVASGLVLSVVCNKCVRGGWGCVWGLRGGAHYTNQLNVLPFPQETNILHIIALSLRGCISSLS